MGIFVKPPDKWSAPGALSLDDRTAGKSFYFLTGVPGHLPWMGPMVDPGYMTLSERNMTPALVEL